MLASVVTADTAVLSRKGTYWGCRLTGDGTNVGTVDVYDGTDAMGTLIDSLSVTADDSAGEMFPHGVTVYTGIFVDVTTPGAVVVWFG